MIAYLVARALLIVPSFAMAALPMAPADIVDPNEEALPMGLGYPAEPKVWYVHDWDKDCVPCDSIAPEPTKSRFRRGLDAKLRWLDRQDWWFRMSWAEREDWLRQRGWDFDKRAVREAFQEAKQELLYGSEHYWDEARRWLSKQDWWARMSMASQQAWLDEHHMWRTHRWHKDLNDADFRWLMRQRWWNRLDWMQQDEWLHRQRPWRRPVQEAWQAVTGCGCNKERPWWSPRRIIPRRDWRIPS